MPTETIHAMGHGNILSTHRNTLELTRDDRLTLRGDCIVAVCADKAMPQLSDGFKEALRGEGAVVELVISCDDASDRVTAYGDPGLILTHESDLVVRKSRFICPRTLAVGADKAAFDLDRRLVEKLKSGHPVLVTLGVQSKP
jgi:uncharacterized protein